MNAHRQPIVHLVGSIPLDNTEHVFRTVCGLVPEHLPRLPDGETGERIGWIRFIQQMLGRHPDLEVDQSRPPFPFRQWDGVVVREIPQVKFKDGTDLSAVKFETGYADAAIDSFAVFERLQSEGVIPAETKFQISIPTPMAPTYNYVTPPARDEFLSVYEPQLMGEVEKIAAALPHDRLAIQWDVCQEVLVYEDYYLELPGDYKEQIMSQLGRIGDAVPAAIELGYHLCYGSPADEHLVLPDDMGILVEMANGITRAVTRQVHFIHMPVPKDRTDDAYFKPLGDLALGDATDLYLGLIHYQDEDGDRERLRIARNYHRVAGISAECGWGRADPARVPGFLESHRKAVSG